MSGLTVTVNGEEVEDVVAYVTSFDTLSHRIGPERAELLLDPETLELRLASVSDIEELQPRRTRPRRGAR